MNFESVIAFGASTVAGLELGSDKDSVCHELSFPQLVANHFAVPCYNYSWQGASNDRTLRILPEKILTHPNSLVLISWIDFTRNEFFYPDCDKNVSADPSGFVQLSVGNVPRFVTEINEFYYKNMYWDPTHYNNYRHYNSLLQAQLICKEFSNSYIQIFEQPNIILEYNNNQRIVLENINFSHVLKFPLKNQHYSAKGWNYGYGNFYEWCKLNKFSFGQYHPLHESHQALADLIINHINNENTIDR